LRRSELQLFNEGCLIDTCLVELNGRNCVGFLVPATKHGGAGSNVENERVGFEAGLAKGVVLHCCERGGIKAPGILVVDQVEHCSITFIDFTAES
jgi:hypothetical protein